MPRRDHPTEPEHPDDEAPGGGADRTARILCLDADADAQDQLARSLAGLPVVVHDVGSLDAARRAMTHHEYDVVLIDADANRGGWIELAREGGATRPATRSILTTRRPTLEAAVDALRAGAVDLLQKPFDPEEVASRLLAAVERAEDLRHQQRRIERLRRICRRLDTAREEVSREVDTLCQDLVSAYQTIAGKVGRDAEQGEYASLVRSELDVEKLLRTTLEYVLSRTGPINAAVFLPTGCEDYSLGAYVNYDIPKSHADVMLDHLADVIPEQFEDESSSCVLRGEAQILEELPDAARWLGDCQLMIAPCRHDDECLAVIALFRSSRDAITDELIGSVEGIRDGFAEQLSRVIRIHNRHRDPDELVTGFDVDLGVDTDADQDDDLFLDDFDIAA
jgi:DNA-binding response OmpR family regulator